MGVALLFPNVRGSSGYGKTFLKLDNGMKREDSYRDVEALLDWVAKRPELNADRVMITGGSYGGHMTLAVATRYAGLRELTFPFAVAVCVPDRAPGA